MEIQGMLLTKYPYLVLAISESDGVAQNFYITIIIFLPAFFLIYISKLSIQEIWLALEEQASHAVVFSGLVFDLLKGKIRFPKKTTAWEGFEVQVYSYINSLMCYYKLCDNKQRKNIVEGKSHWPLCELKGWTRKWQRRIPLQFSQVRILFSLILD